MDTITTVVSAVDKYRKRIWKAFYLRRGKRPTNSTIESTIDLHEDEAEMIMEPKDEKTRLVRDSEEDTQISALAISATKDENKPSVCDIEKGQPRCDSKQSEKMSVEELNLLIMKAKNERVYSERNLGVTQRNGIENETLLTGMMNAIGNMTKEIHRVYKEYKKKKRLNARHQTDLNRINMEIQKQIILNKKLISAKNDMVKTKTEYEDELKYHQDMNIQLKSTTDNQFEQIQRIFAEQEDKTEFIHWQMKVNGNSVHQKTSLFLKVSKQKTFKIRKDKEDEYYKSLCETTLVNGILSNNGKFALATELREREKELRAQFRDSVKNLKMLLHEVDLCKSDVLLQFDDNYEKPDKTEILVLITSIFNLIITIGFMHCWMSEAELRKRGAELWTVENDRGKPVNFKSPFHRTVISFPTDGVLSFKEYYVILNASRAVRNDGNDYGTDKGFKRLQFK